MKPPKELTAYVTRSKRASRFSAEKAADAVKRFLPVLENATEEAAQLQRSLQEAEIAETDPTKRGHFEEAFQKIGAIRRITGDLTVQTRTLVQAFRELDEVNARIAEQQKPATAPVTARTAPQRKATKPTVVKSKPER